MPLRFGCDEREDLKGDGQYGKEGAGGDAVAAVSPPEIVPSLFLESGLDSGGFAGQVRAEVAPAVEALGFQLVELTAVRLARRCLVRLVIYRAISVTADDCAELARSVRYRLALLPGAEEARLEVSTPGTARTFKSDHEYTIFQGRKVEILLEDDWLRGTISTVQEGTITLDTGTNQQKINLQRIRKGRLIEDMSNRSSNGEGTDG